MLAASEALVSLSARVRPLEESQSVLDAQDTPYGVVNTLLADGPLLYQLLQQYAEVDAVGVHRHVDTRVDGQPDGILLVLRDVLAAEQVVDVGPVGDQHAVPAEVLLQPLGQVLVACVQRHAVHAGRVDHHGQRARHGCCAERFEVLLPEHLRRQVRRRAVLARPRRAVGKVVLRAGAHVEGVDVVGVLALVSLNLCHHHLRVHHGVLAEALPNTRPSGVAPQVHHRVVHPGAVRGSALVGRNLGPPSYQFGIERRRHVDGLRKERPPHGVRHAMVVVQSVDVGNAQVFHRLPLYEPYPVAPFLYGTRARARCIQYRAHLPPAYNGVQHLLVQAPDALVVVLSHNVKVQLQHLSNLLVERHLPQLRLNLPLHGLVAGYGRSLCRGGQSGCRQQHGHHQFLHCLL